MKNVHIYTGIWSKHGIEYDFGITGNAYDIGTAKAILADYAEEYLRGELHCSHSDDEIEAVITEMRKSIDEDGDYIYQFDDILESIRYMFKIVDDWIIEDESKKTVVEV